MTDIVLASACRAVACVKEELMVSYHLLYVCSERAEA